LVKGYEYETGYYEYVDSEGNKRIGKKEQKYEVDRGFYGGELLRKKKVGVVDFFPDEDEDEYAEGEPVKRRECPNCLQYGVHIKLAGRILKKGEEKPVDYDQFLQCVNGCGNIFPVHEIERQKKLQVNELKGHVVQNPFDVNATLIESIPKRTSKAGRKAAAKRNRPHHKDKDIDRELQQHGSENVHVLEDTDP
jgi:hypothetical protein